MRTQDAEISGRMTRQYAEVCRIGRKVMTHDDDGVEAFEVDSRF